MNDTYAKCITKTCDKPTVHASGKCEKCRTVTCKRCSKEFIQKNQNQFYARDLCGNCHRQKKYEMRTA